MAKKYSITAIVGDLLECYFVTPLVEIAAVKQMMFSCKGQRICVHIPYSKRMDGWCLRLVGEQTRELRPGTFYFDLSAELVDGNTITLIRDGTFTVYDRENKLCEGGCNAQRL